MENKRSNPNTMWSYINLGCTRCFKVKNYIFTHRIEGVIPICNKYMDMELHGSPYAKELRVHGSPYAKELRVPWLSLR